MTENNSADIQSLAREVVRLRLSMMAINEMIKAKRFRVPVHLGLGHEAIAVAVSAAMSTGDALLLTHRNIHYNLARSVSLRAEVDEYLLLETGLAKGLEGAMNLTNPDRGILYTSSILANCMPVACGVALAEQVLQSGAVAFAVTGDGAMEEGAFYETLLMAKSLELPLILLVENNGWSMYTTIEERRCPIDLAALASALAIPYQTLGGNDVVAYRQALSAARDACLRAQGPRILEVKLATLGDWVLKDDNSPEGRMINYHHGAAPTVSPDDWPVIRSTDDDPLHVLLAHLPETELREMATQLRATLEEAVQ